LECGIIVGGIPEGTMSRKVGLIWGIPVYCGNTAVTLQAINSRESCQRRDSLYIRPSREEKGTNER
jgi:hypothetical protein